MDKYIIEVDNNQIKSCKPYEPYKFEEEHIRADEYTRIIGFLKCNRFCVVDDYGDYYSIEEFEDMLKEQANNYKGMPSDIVNGNCVCD